MSATRPPRTVRTCQRSCPPSAAAAVGSAGVVPADAKGALNYGLDNIRFIAPVPAGKRVTANFKLISVEDKGPKGQLLRLGATLNIDGSDKPAVVGELLALVIG